MMITPSEKRTPPATQRKVRHARNQRRAAIARLAMARAAAKTNQQQPKAGGKRAK